MANRPPPSSLDTVIKNRLLFDTRPLKKALRRFNTYKAVLEAKKDEASRRLALETFLLDFEAMEHALLKHQLIHEMNLREQDNYREEQRKIEQETEERKVEIEGLKQLLEEEERLKKNRMEYDEITKKINELPSRQQSMEYVFPSAVFIEPTLTPFPPRSNAAKLRKEIADLEEEKHRLHLAKDHRRTLFHALLASIQTLRDALAEDHPEMDLSALGAPAAMDVDAPAPTSTASPTTTVPDLSSTTPADDDDAPTDRRKSKHGRAARFSTSAATPQPDADEPGAVKEEAPSTESAPPAVDAAAKSATDDAAALSNASVPEEGLISAEEIAAAAQEEEEEGAFIGDDDKMDTT
ncbi:hypothetical protein HDU96_002517 [Phlyctochytrium bullatum]|nr:hypothetical protein HDU96_002517 [Phlyctochytrium bullatum]